ncbi:unnamed protein product [Lampetra planeri]
MRKRRREILGLQTSLAAMAVRGTQVFSTSSMRGRTMSISLDGPANALSVCRDGSQPRATRLRQIAGSDRAHAAAPKMAASRYVADGPSKTAMAADFCTRGLSETPRMEPCSPPLGSVSCGHPDTADEVTSITRLSRTARRESICSATCRQSSSAAGGEDGSAPTSLPGALAEPAAVAVSGSTARGR